MRGYRLSLTSDGGSHSPLAKSAWRTLAWEARLILKARSYASRVVSRPRAYRSEKVKSPLLEKRSRVCRPFERRRVPRPLQNQKEGISATPITPHRTEKKRGWERRTQVVVFQSHPSVPGQIGVPERDGFEPAGEGF